MAFKLTPAGRSALIISGTFFLFIAMASFWVLKEAQRISRQRDATRATNAEETGDMVWIPAGSFTMGGIGDNIPSDELPLHDVKLDGFWIDRTEVTNEQFAKFVKATAYVTVGGAAAQRENDAGITA